MAKMITDASYKPRDKKKELEEFKAGKRPNPGYMDLTPKKVTKKPTQGK